MLQVPTNRRKSKKTHPAKNNKTFQKRLEERTKSLRSSIERYFPGKYEILEICLSVKSIELIDGITLPFCLILIANPGSSKSTILYTIESLGNCYSTKQFTPKAFVSHMANKTEEELKDIDLLPKIKGKTLITSELASFFSGKEDKLKETLGILTSILDGKGHSSDSGAKGHRGYDENIFFIWIGAIVEISSHVWNMVGFMGPKMYFLRLPEDQSSLEEKRMKILKNLKDDYEEKLTEIKEKAKSFWTVVKGQSKQKDGKIKWAESKDDPNILEKIVMMAQLLAGLRAYLPTKDTAGTSGSNYGYEKPIIEDPNRAAHALYNLARGHAVICGRNFITIEDLRVVIEVVLSSASRDRSELLRLLIENNGQLTTDDIVTKLKITNDTALRKMRQMELLGLVKKHAVVSLTKPVFAIKLKDEFNWLLSDQFKEIYE